MTASLLPALSLIQLNFQSLCSGPQVTSTRTMPSLMWWKRWAYKPVGFPASETEPVEEADEKEPSSSLYDQNPRTTSIITTTITTAGGLFPLVATASAVAFFLLFLFMPRPWLPSDHPHQVRQVSCGNSSQEATMAGCKFDIMSYTWLHPDCFDQQLMYEFLGESDWNWYLDEEGTQSLALNDVAGGQHEYVYVTWQYYITHCTYSKFFFFLFSKTRYSPKYIYT